MKLPYGAQEILDLRAIGKRPADMVLVSLVGKLRGEQNPVVEANHHDYDWRFLHDLEVMIVVNMRTESELVNATMSGIMAVKPAYLGVVWYDRGDGLNICWGDFKPKHSQFRAWTSSDKGAWN